MYTSVEKALRKREKDERHEYGFKSRPVRVRHTLI